MTTGPLLIFMAGRLQKRSRRITLPDPVDLK
jgi:hypothetical protein